MRCLLCLYDFAQLGLLRGVAGDIVSLGTPAGVGALRDGDVFEVRLCKDETYAQNPDEYTVLLSFSHQVRDGSDG